MSHYNQRSNNSNSRSSFSQRGPQRKRFNSRGPRTSTVSHDKYVNTQTVPNVQSEYESAHTFKDFKLHPSIINNLEEKGYKSPTAIQDQAIPTVLEGRDIVGLANTGTGKTGAFILPIIEILAQAKQTNHTLIITPTRELAEQVNDEFMTFSRGMRLYSVVCVGGVNMGKQIREIRRGANIIIGTPGRLKDLASKKILDLSQIKVLVLDEADQMLDMGFLPDMKEIINMTPAGRQVLCFSATMDNRVSGLIAGIQRNPITISVLQKTTSKHIHQDTIASGSKEQKLERLVELLETDEFEKVLVFGETKFGVQRLADSLAARGISSESIHGNKNQSQRRRSLDNFKTDRVRVLVATDVAARGLDIPDVDLVVNYDQPNDHDTYIHRIGRTGRAGKGGHARTFV
jgi:ATP-dependent RNA helicase RhlE